MCRKQVFNFEGHRYFDLARTGRIGSVLNIEEFRGTLRFNKPGGWTKSENQLIMA